MRLERLVARSRNSLILKIDMTQNSTKRIALDLLMDDYESDEKISPPQKKLKTETKMESTTETTADSKMEGKSD